MVPITDLQIEHALDGDDAAARELVAALLPVIRRRVARSLMRRGSGAGLAPEIEDLTQEVLLALFANDRRILKAWSPGRGLPFEKFIGLVARRRVLSILHSRRRNPFKKAAREWRSGALAK